MILARNYDSSDGFMKRDHLIIAFHKPQV